MVGPRKGAPVEKHSHRHEFLWEEVEPVAEDGCVIFTAECTYAEVVSSVTSERHDETFRKTGYECEETRQRVFGLDKLEIRHDGDWVDVPAEAIEYLQSIERLPPEIEDGIIKVERALNSGSAKDVSVDSDEKNGHAYIATEKYRAHYSPDSKGGI